MSLKFNLLLLCLVYSSFSQQWYPTIDPSTHWQVGSFNNAAVRNVSKNVLTSATTSVSKYIFYNVALKHVLYNSTTYAFTKISESVIDADWEPEHLYNGTYSIDGTPYIIDVSYWFFPDGTFKIIANWDYNARPANFSDYKFVFEIDYDLDGSDGDIFEYEWNGKWMGQSSHVSFFPGSLPNYETNQIERNAFARCVDATSPSQQLFVVFGPWNSTPTWIECKPYNESDPVLQDIDRINYFQYSYAYHGKDQRMFVSLSQTSDVVAGIWSKVFQKPNGRSLRINTYVMEGAWVPDLNLIVDNNTSVATALNVLTNSRWENSTKSNLPCPSGVGTEITTAQLHDFMFASRIVSPSIYTSSNRENFRDWYVDVCVVNKRIDYQGSYPYGMMFDMGVNGCRSEASAMSWPECQTHPWGGQRALMFAYIHETGHCFNMQHTWSNCGFAYNQIWCDVANRTIMSYGPNFGSTTMTWCTNNLNWYQNGPEPYVKSGKLGEGWKTMESETAPLNYEPYYK
jgi:hypothetical protein